jgi:rare lipoprotein A (peptidoglycan hydrolase)
MKRFVLALFLFTLAVFVPLAISAAPSPLPVIEGGRATYYAEPFHGRRTASGEIYDMNAITAAHPRWPFHSLVRVTNKDNGKSVDVRINDRGPFTCGRRGGARCVQWVRRDDRHIDLSRAAFFAICQNCGNPMTVRLEVLRWGAVPRGSRACVVEAAP